MDCSTSGLPVLHYLREFAQFHVHWISDAIQLSHPPRPLLLLPSTFPSIRVFSNVLTLRVSWLKYWSFSNSPSSEYSGLISFRIDWFDLLVVQEPLKSLLQHHNSKTSILWCSVFLIVQLSHTWLLEKPYLCWPLSAKYCHCFLICYLGLSWLSFQGASIFKQLQTVLWYLHKII